MFSFEKTKPNMREDAAFPILQSDIGYQQLDLFHILPIQAV